MSKSNSPEHQRMRSRLIRYVAAGYASLCVMALLSSLHISFIWLFGGIALFLFYRAFDLWVSFRREKRNHFSYYAREVRDEPSVLSRWKGIVAKLFHRPYPGQRRPWDAARVFFLFFGGFVGLFVFIMVIGFCSGGDVSSDDALAYKIAGDECYHRRAYDSAQMYYRYSLALDPEYADAYCWMGYAKSESGENDSAVYYYQRALAIDPNFVDAAYGAAVVHYNTRNFDKVLEGVRYILNRSDSYENAYLLAGDVFYGQQRYDSALHYYEPAYDLGARSRDLLYIMAYIYDVQGRTPKAVDFYKETLLYDSTITDIYKRLGELVPGQEGNAYRRKGLGQNW